MKNYAKKGHVLSIFGVLIGILFLMISGLLIREYFYNSVCQRLIGYSSGINNIMESQYNDEPLHSMDRHVSYIENFLKNEEIELMIFNEDDEIILTSSGFLPEDTQSHPDYWQSKESETGMAIWKGKNSNNEFVMATTRCTYDSNEDYIGAVRCVTSLEKARKYIFICMAVVFFIEILVIVGLIFLYNRFKKSIIYPLEDVCSKSKLISQGNFNIRIDKKYNNKIDELRESINTMAQDLRESEKLKNDFISSVSHELRTPLTAIKGWAETMQICNSDPATMKRGLEIIVGEAERLSWIVEGMLDFSGINEKRISLIKEKIDVLAELSEAVYMFKNRAKNENKTIMYSEPRIISTIMGDKSKLKQVFINILDNALKYTSEGGGISIDVSEKGQSICVSVTDNGCGIPIEHLPNVTKKFYKANHAQKGSGIGLAIVDEFIRLHDGELNIISEEGFGTTVTIILPIFKESNLNSSNNKEGNS